MNKQLKLRPDGSVKGRGIEWCDYTWNPISGCFHACSWTMPDGKVANCYAEDVANKFAGTAYEKGFEHHYWKPHLLKAPGKVKEPSKIFVGSMADVFGHWVPEDNIRATIDVAIRLAPWHTYQFLTKNLPRVKQFKGLLGKNCWIGASSPPDFMWNKPLSDQQKRRMLEQILGNMSDLSPDHTTWMSMEPYSWDMLPILKDYPTALKWVVIGAASDGPKYFPPESGYTWALVDWLRDNGIKVFFKGNMKAMRGTDKAWFEEFPDGQ